MDETPDESPDAKLIRQLGGPARICELLGYEKEGGVQRVHNWIARGIPPAVKVQRPDLFMPELGGDRSESKPLSKFAALGA
jgi:hypothetical protein